MLPVGSDDGVNRVTGVTDPEGRDAQRVLESGRVLRIRRLDGIDGVFTATETGLYHSRNGEAWTDLGVPREQVYAVGAGPDGDRVYAGTRPAHVYVARTNGATGVESDFAWNQLI